MIQLAFREILRVYLNVKQRYKVTLDMGAVPKDKQRESGQIDQRQSSEGCTLLYTYKQVNPQGFTLNLSPKYSLQFNTYSASESLCLFCLEVKTDTPKMAKQKGRKKLVPWWHLCFTNCGALLPLDFVIWYSKLPFLPKPHGDGLSVYLSKK